MRVHAPVLRANLPVARTIQARRSMRDTKAFFYCVLTGVMLASYAHDPQGAEALARHARASFQQVTSQMSPASFQAALVDLTKE
jgi:hypothetical protein